VSRSITFAAGIFAPGHVGELTRQVPFDLVDAVLEETGCVQRRLRALPSRVGVYFVLALVLFPDLGYLRVWQRLVAALPQAAAAPSEKALRALRRRVSDAPLRELFHAIAGPVGRRDTPGVYYRHWRTVAFDGCSSIKVPDSPRNRTYLGKRKDAGYPSVRLMTLCETGTRALLGAVFGPFRVGEPEYATRLLTLLTPQMLVLTDRGFDGDEFLCALAACGAQFLVRMNASRLPTVMAKLPDGSILTRIGGISVRVITADITITTADGAHHGERYRLATTLLDHRADPAPTLVRLYHERWEIESAYYGLRHQLLAGRVLRSCDPPGLHQELWATLTLYQALRLAMTEAVQTVPGLDPDRAGFTTALRTAQEQLILAQGILPPPDAPTDIGAIGRAILAHPLPPRRARTSDRTVKCPISRYTQRNGETRPQTSTPITDLTLTLHSDPSLGARYGQAPRTNRREEVLRLMRANPHTTWSTPELSQAINWLNTRSLSAHLSHWVKQGFLQRPAYGRYQLHSAWAATPETP
jgi:hypothetical protein